MVNSVSGPSDGRVAGSALQRVVRLIREEDYRQGMKLPAERNLAETLSVGRPAIREAIRALQVLNVVESRRGDGTYIKSLAGLFDGSPASIQALPDVDTIQLLEVRRMFEPAAAALAAGRATPAHISAIEHELVCQERDPQDYRLLERHDLLFHEAIVEAAGNVVLSGIMRNLTPLLLKSLKITAQTTLDIPKVIRQHRAILETIRHGQSDLAEIAMKEHLQTTALDLLSDQKR